MYTVAEQCPLCRKQLELSRESMDWKNTRREPRISSLPAITWTASLVFGPGTETSLYCYDERSGHPFLLNYERVQDRQAALRPCGSSASKASRLIPARMQS
jgi:hypothetical protein